jgi:hypothetical protein
MGEQEEYKMEKKKNLKGRDGKLVYYRYSDTEFDIKIVTRYVKKKDKETGKEFKEEQKFERKQPKEIIFSEEDVRTFSLEKHGQKVPYSQGDGNITLLHNYLLDFWSYFLGSDACITYIHLIRYAYNKDSVFPSLDTIAVKMRCDRRTLTKYIDILESFGFVYRFWTKKPEDNNRPGTILFKVRKTLPLLSEELIHKLPSDLKGKHDLFIIKLSKSHEIEFNAKDNYDSFFTDFIRNSGKLLPTKKDIALEKNAETLDELYQIRVNRLERNREDIKLWNSVMDIVSRQVSKPSFDMSLLNSVATFLDSYVVCFTKRDFLTPIMKERYERLIAKGLYELTGKEYKIEFESVLKPFEEK